MEWIALLPIGMFGLMSTAVAIKLLLLARRTRQFPELAISSSTLLLATVGIPLTVVGRSPAHFGTAQGEMLFAAGVLFVCLGLQMTYLFCWNVFRRSDAWARWVVVASGLAFLGVWLSIVEFGLGETELQAAQAKIKPYAIALLALQVLGAAWNGIESWVYWEMQRKRLRLGLADPLVVERFLWWGLSHLASSMLGLTLIGCLLSGKLIMRDPFSLLVLGVAGSVLVLTWGLSFFPPRLYVRWVEARAISEQT